MRYLLDLCVNKSVYLTSREAEGEKMSDVKKQFKIKHKDIIDELLLREISQGNEILEVLHDLKILSIPFKGYLSESDAYIWFENKPSKIEKKQVLAALGYDVENL